MFCTIIRLVLRANDRGSENVTLIWLSAGFSLTPYLESFTPTFGLGTPVFPGISSNLHCGTPTFSKRCLWDTYFQNPSENPVSELDGQKICSSGPSCSKHC